MSVTACHSRLHFSPTQDQVHHYLSIRRQTTRYRPTDGTRDAATFLGTTILEIHGCSSLHLIAGVCTCPLTTDTRQRSLHSYNFHRPQSSNANQQWNDFPPRPPCVLAMNYHRCMKARPRSERHRHVVTRFASNDAIYNTAPEVYHEQRQKSLNFAGQTHSSRYVCQSANRLPFRKQSVDASQKEGVSIYTV